MKKFLALSLFTVLLVACNSEVKEEAAEVTELADSSTSMQVEIIEVEEESTFPNYDPESETCTERVEKNSDMYGDYTVWPLIENEFSYHRTSELGQLFAHYACGGEEAVKAHFSEGTNLSGIYATTDASSPEELKTLLAELGFQAEEEREEGTQTWVIDQNVDILPLLALKEYYMDFGSVWGGLSE